MRRFNYRPYVLLAATLFLLLTLPEVATLRMRRAAISSVAPSWKALNFLKNATLHFLTIMPPGSRADSAQLTQDNESLLLENHTLRAQLTKVREWLLEEERLDEQLQRWHSLSQKEERDPILKEFYHRRARELKESLDLQLKAVPAKVAFREPISWSSYLWLNVGERENLALKRKIVAKNSPVVLGCALVGVVEEVGYKECKVRLITDAGLVPSVRAVRGQEQNRFLVEHLDGLLLGLGSRHDLFNSHDDAKGVLALFTKLRDHLNRDAHDHFLAKGELYGTSQPLWRARDQILRGVGFNYDYADEEGGARDLRTGEILSSHKKQPISLLKAGDLLITTGLDGIFPPGLRVGIITQAIPLKEGASSYEIEAKAACGNLNDLQHLTVLPPLQ